MKKILSTLKTQFFVVFLICSLFPGFAPGQQNIGPHTIMQFSPEHILFTPQAPALKETTKMESGKNKAIFVNGVGGISFDQIAAPEKGFRVNKLRINYQADNPDGQRMQLIINDQNVTVNLPDWILFPVVKYADSPYYSCITLFGKLGDPELAKEVTKNNGRVINYHPAFVNTLLGIRLLYMDMLVGYNFTNNLPKDVNNKYILGKGEDVPDLRKNQEGAYLLSQLIIHTQNQYQTTFRSYVISDYSIPITFTVENNSLHINGTPYFLCWHFKSDNEKYDINKIADDLSNSYNQKIKEINENEGYDAVQKWLIYKLISVANRYKGNYSFYSEGTFVDLIHLENRQQQVEMLKKYAPESLFDLIVQTEVYMDRDSVIYMKDFSDAISSKPELFHQANPEVYNATVNTMRYAAFFRYIKEEFPEVWNNFYQQVQSQKIPVVYTPTVMCDPKDQSLIKKLKKTSIR